MNVGAELKKARIARARYIPEIAHELHVPPPIIQAIEHDDFASAGPNARDIVRAYALAVGLDAEALVAAFDAAPPPEPAKPKILAVLDGPVSAVATSSNARRTLLTVGAVVIAGAAVWAVQALWRAPSVEPSVSPSATSQPTSPSPSTPTDSATASPTSSATASETPSETATVVPSETATVVPSETPTTTASPTATATPTATKTPTPKPTPIYEVTRIHGLIRMSVSCVKASSLHVYNASGTLFSGRMRAGETKSFTSDTDATFTTSNAAGLRLTVNGHSYGVLGAAGQVYTHAFRIG